ncbi:uncharacterized protein LACBIDRAFT_334175 [Laccaria bicolor S238N-H82]|uniref:Predicted protein n=1 Tax=Laccaria bicolor (strain S238N-H82 / ATCC MYA-4686) TaxID=486041 RepID=B0DYC1_LACBS|nr:uncharacterized protein LACBIDRAFT_334175 [Laccaria bicolor S238N-H82]EDR00410.1 predicted protein [Laccaria bicolor S238N-H82]|eukprot:XP_001888969.1 predicted protein [Laccaria bicolor S238N-H82]
MDTVRIHDGARVVIKEVATWKEEIPIVLYLSSEALRQDPRNCAVPILDILLLPDTDEFALMVMPMLLGFARLPFRRIGEVAEMFQQWLKGIELMHEHNIAYRAPIFAHALPSDACWFNLMMETSRVIPTGFHFGDWRTVDGVHPIVWRDRWSVRLVKYFFIDFDLSLRYSSKNNCCEIGQIGQDRSVPEMATPEIPYDPFKADIYQLGKVILKIISEYEGLELFKVIGEIMTKANPDERPLASEAAEQLETLILSLTPLTLRHRVWKIGELKLGSLDRLFVKYFGTRRVRYIYTEYGHLSFSTFSDSNSSCFSFPMAPSFLKKHTQASPSDIPDSPSNLAWAVRKDLLELKAAVNSEPNQKLRHETLPLVDELLRHIDHIIRLRFFAAVFTGDRAGKIREDYTAVRYQYEPTCRPLRSHKEGSNFHNRFATTLPYDLVQLSEDMHHLLQVRFNTRIKEVDRLKLIIQWGTLDQWGLGHTLIYAHTRNSGVSTLQQRSDIQISLDFKRITNKLTDNYYYSKVPKHAGVSPSSAYNNASWSATGPITNVPPGALVYNNSGQAFQTPRPQDTSQHPAGSRPGSIEDYQARYSVDTEAFGSQRLSGQSGGSGYYDYYNVGSESSDGSLDRLSVQSQWGGSHTSNAPGDFIYFSSPLHCCSVLVTSLCYSLRTIITNACHHSSVLFTSLCQSPYYHHQRVSRTRLCFYSTQIRKIANVWQVVIAWRSVAGVMELAPHRHNFDLRINCAMCVTIILHATELLSHFTLLPPVVSLHCGNASPPPSRVTIAQPHPTIIAPQASTSRTTTYPNDNNNHLGRADGGPSELPSLIVFYHNAQGGHVAVGDMANNNRWRMTNDRQRARTTANDNANQNRPRSFMQTTTETNHNELRCYISVGDLAAKRRAHLLPSCIDLIDLTEEGCIKDDWYLRVVLYIV